MSSLAKQEDSTLYTHLDDVIVVWDLLFTDRRPEWPCVLMPLDFLQHMHINIFDEEIPVSVLLQSVLMLLNLLEHVYMHNAQGQCCGEIVTRCQENHKGG